MAQTADNLTSGYAAWYEYEFGHKPPGETAKEKAAAAKAAAQSDRLRASYQAWYNSEYGGATKSQRKKNAATKQVAAQQAQQQVLSNDALAAQPAAVKPAAPSATLDPFSGQNAAGFGVVSGYANFAPNGPGDDAIQHKVAGPAYQNANDYAKEHLSGLDSSELQVLQKQLGNAGYLPKGHASGLLDGDTFKAYSALLQDTSLANTAGNIITPEDYLKAKAKTESKGAQTHTATSRSVTLASPDDAKSLALQTFRQALGRAPHPGELSAFMAALNSYERSHAQVTNRTSTTDADGNETSASSTTSGGGNDQQFATDFVSAHDSPEQQSYAGGTAYFQAALDVLRAGGAGFSNDPIAETHTGG